MSTRLRSASIAIGLSLILPWAAAAQRPMTPDDVVGVKAVSSPAISPDGRATVFVVRQADLDGNRFTQHLWRHDEGSSQARQITFEGTRNVSPRWAPDGRAVAFLSNRDEKTQIYVLPRDGGEARPLTSHPTPVQAFRWSPDGRTIAFTAADPKGEAQTKREKAGYDEVVVNQTFDWAKLWTVDVESGRETQLTTDDVNIDEFVWSPDGSRFALRTRPTTLLDLSRECEIDLMPAAGGPMVRLTDNETLEYGFVWARDGRSIYYNASDESRFANAEARLFRIDVDTKAITRLASDYQYGIGDLALSPDSRRMLFVGGVRASQRLSSLDLASGAVTELSRADGTVSGYDVSADGRTVALVFSDASHLPAIWRGGLDPFAAAPTPTINPQADAWQLGETRAIEWKSRDGWEVEGVLTLPVGYEAGRRYPLLVMLHGGPEAAVTLSLDQSYIEYPQVWAGRGWTVLQPNYRGGSNYGDRFLQGMNGDTGGGDYQDIMTGVDAVVAQGIADPQRMAVMGWSWGGISTGWIVGHTDRFKAASAGAMVANHFSVFGEADLTYDVEYFYVGGTPWADPAKYIRMSPIGHVMQARTPTLLLHGMDDIRCPTPQSMEFYRGLKAAGVETELVFYPREPHVFREPAHQLDKMRRELEWMERHVK